MDYEAKVELIRRVFGIWNERELEAALEYVHPEVEWISAGLFPDVDPVYRGPDGVRRFWREFMEPWETIQIEVERFVKADDDVLALVRFYARGSQGLEFDLRVGQLFTITDDGKVIRFQAFATYEEGLEAIGADEAPT